jgi:hypothetical protein
LVEGGIAGCLIGAIIAACFGLPILLSIAIVSWACWLLPYSYLPAGIAGAVTGAISTAVTWDAILMSDFTIPDFTWAVMTAACIGGAVPSLATWFFLRWQRQFAQNSDAIRDIHWQYSLRDLFVRFTLIAALVAAWTIAIAKFREARKSATSQSQLSQID